MAARLLKPSAWVLTAWLLGITAAWAAPLAIDPQQQLQYAQQLYDQEQFLRAAEEFERFAFFFPEAAERRQALFKAGRAFLQAGDPPTALKRFNALTRMEPLDPVAEDAHFMAAECHARMGNPNLAVVEMQTLIARTDDPALRDSAYLRIGWVYIDQMDWSGARQALGRISPEGRARFEVDSLETGLARADEIPSKNPTLAGTLSIVPGAGQLYCGRYEDALAALVVNGGLFLAAYESFDNDLDALGVLLSIAGLGFYTANIYGAVSDAHKFNRAHRQTFVDQLREQMRFHVGTLPSPHARYTLDGLVVAVRFNF